jgi:hypothetical protein
VNRSGLATWLALACTAGASASTHAQAPEPTSRTTTDARSKPEDAPVSRWDRGWAFHLSLGVGTQVGVVGLQVERRVTSWLAAQAGGGFGAHPQFAGMARLRIPTAPAVNFGVGVSGGGYRQNDCWFCDREYILRWHPALWNNYELSLEHRAEMAFTLRAFAGVAALLNPNAAEVDCNACEVGGSPPKITKALGYGGIAIGASFD